MNYIKEALKELFESDPPKYLQIIAELETEENLNKLGRKQNKHLNDDTPQKLHESWRDPQTDIITTHLLLTTINKETCIIDYGCGPFCTLFFNLNSRDIKNIICKKITYYAFGDDIIYDEIISQNYYEIIKNFKNENLNIIDVIYNIKGNEIITNEILINIKKADLLICKNLNHEITLFQMPFFIYNIYQLTKYNGKFIFFDLLEINERQKLPWFVDDYQVLFEKIFNEKVTPIQLDVPEEFKDIVKKKRKPLILCEIIKINDISLLPENELRRKLIDFYENRAERLVSKKNEIYDKLEMRENKRLEKELDNIIRYHSNCVEQLKVAKKEWGL